MAKVTIKAKAEEIEKAGQDLGDFVVPKPGFYHVKIVEANPGFSKDEDGNDDKDRPRIEIVFEIVGEGMEAKEPEANYGRLWDYITFGDGYAATRRVEFAQALDPTLTPEQIEAGVTFDTDEMVERVLIARVKQEKDKLRSEEEKKTVYRARIAMLRSLDAADGYTAAEYDQDTFGGDEEPAADEDPFGGGGEEEASLLTEEELNAYDLKELGAVAKEFDIDPAALIVRNKAKKVDADKTKAAVVAAILEAQGGGEDEAEPDAGDDGSDDDPF